MYVSLNVKLMRFFSLPQDATCEKRKKLTLFVESATCHKNMMRKTFLYIDLRKTLKFI